MGLQQTKLPGLRLSGFAITRVDHAMDAKETRVPLGVNDVCSLGRYTWVRHFQTLA